MKKEQLINPVDMAYLDYFEQGCLCVLSGRINKAASRDDIGVQYYLDNCTCTRHPDSANRECWDRDDALRVKALEKINSELPRD
jgi:hypothetical protein